MPLDVVSLLAEGPLPYAEGLRLQRDYVARRQRGTVPDTFLLLEHLPTVTYGKIADLGANLRLHPDEYASLGIELLESDRGGDVTWHGPGQLVGYPIIHLGEGSRDLHRYVRAVEGCVIDACHALGATDANRASWHAGVWVGDGYLAALGIRVTRWVSHHGFALNVDRRVHPGFATIVPCGVQDKKVVSLEDILQREVSLREAADAVSGAFQGLPALLTERRSATLDSEEGVS